MQSYREGFITFRVPRRHAKTYLQAWPPEYEELARYNAEVGRGLVHTPEHEARMMQIQKRYDQDMERQIKESGG